MGGAEAARLAGAVLAPYALFVVVYALFLRPRAARRLERPSRIRRL